MLSASPADSWRALTVTDIDALYERVRELHPGIRDPAAPDFSAKIDTAYAAARKRAESAQSFSDWRAVTTSFMLSFRDGHTIFRPTVIPSRVRWPGFLIDSRGGHYYLRKSVAGEYGSMRLVSCDGVLIEDLLRDRLDLLEADWSKLPERIRQAWRLFVDYQLEGKPPILACDVETAGKRESLKLDWQPISWVELGALVDVLSRQRSSTDAIRLTELQGAAFWIRLSSFGRESELAAVETELKRTVGRLRQARYIVFDLRGNRGGNSTWGERIAEIVWGEKAVGARKLINTSPGGKYFRASPQAAEQATAMASAFEDDHMPESFVRYWRGVAKMIAEAPDRDTALVRDPCCGPESKPPPLGIPPDALYRGKTFVLTDAGCFSSCVLVMNTLREMGATQVGESSGQNEVYGEIAGPFTTPSGLARYSIPLSIIRQSRESLGGLAPDRQFDGPMDDIAALRKWIDRMGRERATTRFP